MLPQILLGSASPRRRELLAGLDIPFTAITINADESYPADLQAGDIPYFISRAKAQAYLPQLQPSQLLITADTIVWCDGHMLGKPHTPAEAHAMLRTLSGKTHQVFTAVTFAHYPIPNPKSEITNLKSQITNLQSPILTTLLDSTDVTFAELTDARIDYYITHYRPFDKAGAYGIQEWLGYVACTSIRGSYFNVMGLPVHLVSDYLHSL